jgi:uncharacterized membrane protein YgcG
MNLFNKSKMGDIITLQKQDVEVVECIKTGKLMVNLDADEVMPGDLLILKRRGVLLSNPDTKEDICIDYEFPVVEHSEQPNFGQRLNSWFQDDDDDDDSGFFTTPTTSTYHSPTFGGSSTFGGFGGFGGGMFSGGGASRGF